MTDAEPDADVGLVYAHDSEWMMQFEPPLASAGAPDRAAHARIVGAFGRAAVDAGLQVGYVNERQLPEAAELVRRHPVLVVAGLVAASDPTLDTLAEYARLGGRLVVGPRTGHGDDEGRVRATTAPAVIGPAAGVASREYAALAAPVAVVAPDGPLVGAAGQANGWADALEAGDAEVLLRYDHPLFGRWAAATRSLVGDGTITFVGTLLDRSLLRAVVTDAAGPAATQSPIAERQLQVTAHSLAGPHGRAWVVHNWSPEGRAVTLAKAVASVVDDTTHGAGTVVELAPWDVRIWREA
nr:beta-galactosidase trimerization domain-containing protein [Microbacterium sp. CFH 90308]